MLLLVSTSDKIQVVTGQAVTVDVHADFVDYASGTVTPSRLNTAITTAATTDVVASPAASTQRNVKLLLIRNKHATSSVDVTVRHTDGTTIVELHKVTLLAGETLQYSDAGFVKLTLTASVPALTFSTADQAIGASVTAYLTGSDIHIPTNRPLVIGSILRWEIVMSKTAAATAAQTFDVRFGTAGTTSDTSRLNFTTGTQTAVADVAHIFITCIVRGPIGASAVVSGGMALEHNLSATGFALTPNVVGGANSAGFDVTTAGLIAGISTTTGASHAITVIQVIGEIINI